ncbi:hypothetical protein EYM_05475 [Ignicoccus islandicus DSM 13165]|uniref:Uncharacterized protein n=1 Tax=Ignicoccus islandicus DSM 13165 TaxID=940295 RepID=A0A0U2WLQ5_9CREN|nr:hypothetical protein [Ignicoccus islandicus]ALU11857.1 hypothetical protein EYM_05475 [Ignicoccus islandicus DSM 13165]
MNYEDLVSIILLGAITFALTISMLMSVKKKNEESKGEFKTLIKCPKCGYERVREWKEGDFIGMIEGRCPKCGSLMKVEKIYKDVEEEEEENKILKL